MRAHSSRQRWLPVFFFRQPWQRGGLRRLPLSPIIISSSNTHHNLGTHMPITSSLRCASQTKVFSHRRQKNGGNAANGGRSPTKRGFAPRSSTSRPQGASASASASAGDVSATSSLGDAPLTSSPSPQEACTKKSRFLRHRNNMNSSTSPTPQVMDATTPASATTTHRLASSGGSSSTTLHRLLQTHSTIHANYAKLNRHERVLESFCVMCVSAMHSSKLLEQLSQHVSTSMEDDVSVMLKVVAQRSTRTSSSLSSVEDHNYVVPLSSAMLHWLQSDPLQHVPSPPPPSHEDLHTTLTELWWPAMQTPTTATSPCGDEMASRCNSALVATVDACFGCSSTNHLINQSKLDDAVAHVERMLHLVDTLAYFKWAKDYACCVGDERTVEEESRGGVNTNTTKNDDDDEQSTIFRAHLSMLRECITNDSSTASSDEIQHLAKLMLDHIPKMNLLHTSATSSASEDVDGGTTAPMMEMHVLDLLLGILFRYILVVWPLFRRPSDRAVAVRLAVLPWSCAPSSSPPPAIAEIEKDDVDLPQQLEHLLRWYTWLEKIHRPDGAAVLVEGQPFIHNMRLLCWPTMMEGNSHILRRALSLATTTTTNTNISPHRLFKDMLQVLVSRPAKQQLAHELLHTFFATSSPQLSASSSSSSSVLSLEASRIGVESWTYILDADFYLTKRMLHNATTTNTVCWKNYALSRAVLQHCCTYFTPHVWQKLNVRQARVLWDAVLRCYASPMADCVLRTTETSSSSSSSSATCSELIHLHRSLHAKDGAGLRQLLIHFTRKAMQQLPEKWRRVERDVLAEVGGDDVAVIASSHGANVALLDRFLHCAVFAAALVAPLDACEDGDVDAKEEEEVVALRESITVACRTLMSRWSAADLASAVHLLNRWPTNNKADTQRGNDDDDDEEMMLLRVVEAPLHRSMLPASLRQALQQWVSRQSVARELTKAAVAGVGSRVLQTWASLLRDAEVGLRPFTLPPSAVHAGLWSLCSPTPTTTPTSSEKMEVAVSFSLDEIATILRVLSCVHSRNGHRHFTQAQPHHHLHHQQQHNVFHCLTEATNHTGESTSSAEVVRQQTTMIEKVLRASIQHHLRALSLTSMMEAWFLEMISADDVADVLHQSSSSTTASWMTFVEAMKSRRQNRFIGGVLIHREGVHLVQPSSFTDKHHGAMMDAWKRRTRGLRELLHTILLCVVDAELAVVSGASPLVGDGGADDVPPSTNTPADSLADAARLDRPQHIVAAFCTATHLHRLRMRAENRINDDDDDVEWMQQPFIQALEHLHSPLHRPDVLLALHLHAIHASTRELPPSGSANALAITLFTWMAVALAATEPREAEGVAYMQPTHTATTEAALMPNVNWGAHRTATLGTPRPSSTLMDYIHHLQSSRTATDVGDAVGDALLHQWMAYLISTFLLPSIQAEIHQRGRAPSAMSIIHSMMCLLALSKYRRGVFALPLRQFPAVDLINRVAADRRLLARHRQSWLMCSAMFPACGVAVSLMVGVVRDARDGLSVEEMRCIFGCLALAADDVARQRDGGTEGPAPRTAPTTTTTPPTTPLVSSASSTRPGLASSSHFTPPYLRQLWSTLSRQLLLRSYSSTSTTTSTPLSYVVVVEALYCGGCVGCADTLLFEQLLAWIMCGEWPTSCGSSAYTWTLILLACASTSERRREYANLVREPLLAFLAEVELPQVGTNDGAELRETCADLCRCVEAIPRVFVEEEVFWLRVEMIVRGWRDALRQRLTEHQDQRHADVAEHLSRDDWPQQWRKSFAWAARCGGYSKLVEKRGSRASE